MQKKAMLYVFGIAAFFGLVLGSAFFINDLRLKIVQGPDKDQFAAETGVNAVLPSASSAKTSAPVSAAVPPRQTPPAPPEKTDVPAQTPPPAADPASENSDEKSNSFSFAIIGDTQRFDPDKSDGGLQKAVKNIISQNPDLVMTEGDLLGSCDGGSGCEKGLNDWKSALGGLYAKTYEMMGNHDRSGGEKADALWKKFFDLPQNGPKGYEELAYSFDFENSHFVILNSEKPGEHAVDKVQRDWLEKDLTDNKKENIFVFFHEPAYPVKHKIGTSLDAEPEERDALWEILKKYKVAAVFNGHEHIASRRKEGGIYQFVFGNTDAYDHELPEAGVAEYSYQGENYGIVKVQGKDITVETYSIDGNSLDSFKLPA